MRALTNVPPLRVRGSAACRRRRQPCLHQRTRPMIRCAAIPLAGALSGAAHRRHGYRCRHHELNRRSSVSLRSERRRRRRYRRYCAAAEFKALQAAGVPVGDLPDFGARPARNGNGQNGDSTKAPSESAAKRNLTLDSSSTSDGTVGAGNYSAFGILLSCSCAGRSVVKPSS
jgi:hypothetical protein